MDKSFDSRKGPKKEENILCNMDEGKDHISELPEPIIHHILSMVRPLDAVHTSILSKAWRHIYSSFPIFTFEPSLIREYHKFKQIKDWKERKHMKVLITKKLLKVLDDTFQRVCEQHTLPWIQKFSLYMDIYDNECASHIDNWIGLASDRNVEELDISICGELTTYYLPNTVLNAKSLRVLKLRRCNLDHIFFEDTIKFPSLRDVYIASVSVNEQTIEKIISSCPSIETFDLETPLGLKCFQVSGLHKLKKVRVVISGDKQILDKVDIEAPSLQYFRLLCLQSKAIRTLEINMSACQNMKILKLIAANITDQSFQYLLPKLPLLEEIYLSRCHLIQRVGVFSNQLKKLTLAGCRILVDAYIDTPNLLSFEFKCYGVPSLCLKNTTDQLEVGLEFVLHEDFDTLCFLNLRKFLAKFRQIKSLTFSLHSKKYTFIPEESRGNSVPPVCDVKHLRLNGRSSSLSHAALLDGLFWSLHPQTISLQLLSDDEINFIKMLCEKIVNREDPDCCNASVTKCWQDLKEIKIKSFPGKEYGMPLLLNTFLNALPSPSKQDVYMF